MFESRNVFLLPPVELDRHPPFLPTLGPGRRSDATHY
jgi:hypothetical protein